MPSNAVLRELRTVCQGPAFLKSGEAVRLLRYLVEAEQAGQAAKLREVLIGCGLYGRVASYDPKLDAVVRVNATRLRARLEEHYTLHPESPLRIVLPKGSYVPVYEVRTVEGPAKEIETGVPAPLGVAPAMAGVPPRPTLRSRPIMTVIAACSLAVFAALGWFFWKARSRQTQGTWVARPFSRMGGVEQFPDFSPDGRSVVFAWAKSEKEPPALYVQDVSSDIPRPLTGEMRAERRGAWSPDGRRLALVHSSRDGTNHILVRAMADGSEKEVAAFPILAPWLCSNPKLSWSRDGETLYTVADGGDGRCGVVAIDLASLRVRVLTHPSPVTLGDVEATVSPDGKTVAFLRTVSYGVVDVWTVPEQGGPERRLTLDNREIMGFTWKPGGAKLVLASRGEDGTVRLVERDVEIGSATLLTDGTAPAAFPAVSPLQDKMVFTSYRSAANLYRLVASQVTELVVDQSLKSAPQLSPDGQHLAYASDRTGFAEVWISDADGRNGVRLTHTAGTGAQAPAWFPDGTSVLFECRDLQHSQICAMPVSGKGGMQRLTNWSADQVLPSLSRDGRFLYFMSNRTGKLEAYREALPRGEPEQLTSGGAVHVAESWDRRRMYIETGKDDVGFLVVPVEYGKVDTSELTEANRTYARPQLTPGGMSAWNAGPQGIAFFRPSRDGNELVEVDDQTGRQRVLRQIRGGEEVASFSVGPDGTTVVYATRAKRFAELGLLTNSKGSLR